MKLNKIYKNKILIPENVEIQKKQSNLCISGLLGSTVLNLEKLDNMGLVSFNLNTNLPFNKNQISSDPVLNVAKKTQENSLAQLEEVLHHPLAFSAAKQEEARSQLLCNAKGPLVAKLPAGLSIKKQSFFIGYKKQKNLILHSNHKPFLKSISNIIKNKITGVSSGFLISIRIIGVGYRAEIIKKKKTSFTF